MPGSFQPAAASRLSLLIAVGVVTATFGAEADPRLQLQPVVWKPDCERPAAFESGDWNYRALGFSISYVDGTANAPQLTKDLAQHFGFAVTGGDAFGFFARWLEPRQIAELRCVREVKSVMYVLPVE